MQELRILQVLAQSVDFTPTLSVYLSMNFDLEMHLPIIAQLQVASPHNVLCASKGKVHNL
jgi:hypothetical protein